MEKIKYYYDRLLYWQENTDKLDLQWADFLQDDTRPNKERVLSDKGRQKQQVFNSKIIKRRIYMPGKKDDFKFD